LLKKYLLKKKKIWYKFFESKLMKRN
jgi:hypothetical protein